MQRGFLAESLQKAIFTGCYVCIFQTDCCRRQELRRGADTTGMKYEPQSAEWSQTATQLSQEHWHSSDAASEQNSRAQEVNTSAVHLTSLHQIYKGIHTNNTKANVSSILLYTPNLLTGIISLNASQD